MKVKKIVMPLLCLVLSVAVYAYLCIIVTPKDINDSGGALYYNGMGFLAEPEDSLHVLIYGNSDVYSGFAPAVLYEKTGYTSYASGRARQTVDNIESLLHRTLKTQKPKLVILETDCFFDACEKEVNEADVLYAPFVYHARWKEIKARDFYTMPNRQNSLDINKGYINSNRVYATDLNDQYMGSSDATATPIPEENVKYITEILETCQKNGIEVLFVELPSVNSWDYGKHNAVAKLAEENGVRFLDFNAQPQGYELDPQNDFRDNGDHLNRYGAAKTTAYIGAYLQTHYAKTLSEQADANTKTAWDEVVAHYQKALETT